MRHIKITCLRLLLIGPIISNLLLGCATTEKSTDSESDKSHYTIEFGEVEKHLAPLPDYYPFYLNWYQGSELVKRYLKYRGWDFSGNGLVDYLEELNENGESIGHYFDFDQDAIIDAQVGQR
ncbi:MAG: hypothetical protein ACOH5I_15995 [Oligoflexus sp.]